MDPVETEEKKTNPTPHGMETPRAIILMGVSGCGKTTVGQRLSQKLGWPFFDGDDFHPEANRKKMASGTPLTDADRMPWLASLNRLIAKNLAAQQSMILACSALKNTYRDRLRGSLSGVSWVYLKGDYDLIFKRMQTRTGHYMKPGMLQSQFETLEPPKNAITVNIGQPVETIVDLILNKITDDST
jgi:gluconokinase